jgi:hypothetical protein
MRYKFQLKLICYILYNNMDPPRLRTKIILSFINDVKYHIVVGTNQAVSRANVILYKTCNQPIFKKLN